MPRADTRPDSTRSDGTWCYLLKRFPQLTQTFVAAELCELERQGARLAVIARNGPSDASAAPIQGLRAPVRYLGDPAALHDDPTAADAEITGLALELGATHLHSHFAGWAAGAAARVAPDAGLTYSVTAHATDIYRDGVDPAALVELMVGARFVVTVTEDNRRHLEALLAQHGRTARVVRLYNGVDLTRLHAPAESAGRDPGLVVGAGRLVAKKGHDVLIEAVRRVRATGRDVRAVIVGEGPLRAELAAQIDAAGLDGVVDLVGSRDHEGVLGLLRRASVFVLPSVIAPDGDRDALPTVILEAMALGTPVLSTTVSGIPEMVQDGVSGRLVAPGDPAATAAALERMLADESLRQHLAGNARTRVEERFDLARNVGLLHGLLAESTTPHGSTPHDSTQHGPP